MEFESNGMLSAGIHDCTMQEFIEFFVDKFPTSQRRKTIANNLLDFAKDILATGTPVEFWVDGSFVTTKINPNDADLVLFFHLPHMQVLAPQHSSLQQKYLNSLDFYFSLAVSPENEKLIKPSDYHTLCVNQRNYWRGQFGFDRQDSPKGIVRISCDSIIEYLKGR